MKTHFAKSISHLRMNNTMTEVSPTAVVDNLMIDMNGVFHASAQKIFKYGNHKPQTRLLGRGKGKGKGKGGRRQTISVAEKVEMFDHVCKTVELVMRVSNPTKRVILCVDGVAPLGKQNQQRQRRFRAAKESTGETVFNSNSLTPGTVFMHELTTYIDKYIKENVKTNDEWKRREIIFSSEKVPGEGEHKLINYIRYYGIRSESYCVYALDADLVMLAVGTQLDKFFVLRDDLFDARYEYSCIDIGHFKTGLAEMLRWNSKKHEFVYTTAMNDFILLCFMTGNDFLPHIPSIEIIDEGIEQIFDIYKSVCSTKGHLTYYDGNGKLRLNPSVLASILGQIGIMEKDNYEAKLSARRSAFRDELLEQCTERTNGKTKVYIDKYRTDYYNAKFGNISEEVVCHKYIEGMQWVLSYYVEGVPNWKWFFPYHYAPAASMIATYASTYKHVDYDATIPATPFQQLLSVLPPKSAYLIPRPLNRLLTDPDSPLRANCPDTFEIDLSGKRREWEGIVLLPMVDYEVVRNAYLKYIRDVHQRDLQRNIARDSTKYECIDGNVVTEYITL